MEKNELLNQRKLVRFMMALITCLVLLIISTAVSFSQVSYAMKSSDFSSGEIKTALLSSQPTREISGIIKDDKGMPLVGATVVVKGTTIGVITNNEGRFILRIPANAETLVVSFVGMASKEIPIGENTLFEISLEEELIGLDEVVVVGYGTQKRESIVGAITNTTSEALEKRGGVVNLASALSGQLPSVIVMERTGEPGREDPFILIRGQSTWNDAAPLILVDGVERRMNDINVNEVASVSVLKDASATAVFGVKGANGVILINTKRGELGKAKFTLTANVGLKNASKVFKPVEAFEAMNWKNAAVEHEVSTNEQSWQYITPYEHILPYKKPQQYPEIYPNVDWHKEIMKPFATNSQVNLNVSGGSEFAKYFASVAYTNEGDILMSGKNSKGYDPKYSYDRLNYRGNLDFQLTETTKLSANLSGYLGNKKETAAFSNNWIFRGIYDLAPNSFPVRYSDGHYGIDPGERNVQNPVAILNESGISRNTRLFIGTDVKLEQKLDFITKGLSANANLSYDNTYGSSGPTLSDGGNTGQVLYKFLYPEILTAQTRQDSLNATHWQHTHNVYPVNEYDWYYRPWSVSPSSASSGIQRVLFYQLSLNYGRTFNKHDVSALALFNRRENASGSEFSHYREDWVGRVTYGFNNKYFAEVNGAYNGSEKFGPGYRFGFFPSLALGWMISNERFMKEIDWLYKLKVRGSIGKVGSDSGIPRWGYIGSWTNVYPGAYTTSMIFTSTGSLNNTAMFSPYRWYWEGTIPNPDLSWETALKRNIGFELGLFENMLSLEVDLFKDERSNIFMSATDRNIPAFFGADAVPANIGQTETKGIEIDAMFRKTLQSGFNFWVRQTMTRAKDLVIKSEDPELNPAYLKREGFQIGQTKSQVRNGTIATSWDDVYAQTSLDNNMYKLPGDWGILDYNGDGIINTFDNIPYGYPGNRPANTYSTFLGLGYKDLNFMIQFYGVTNITQGVSLSTPGTSRAALLNAHCADYWSIDNPDAVFKAPRLVTTSLWGEYTRFDGSFLRLKTIELSYDIPKLVIDRLGLSSLRLFINGNNLFFWSKLPMDKESGSYDLENSYPTYRVINTGLNVVF